MLKKEFIKEFNNLKCGTNPKLSCLKFIRDITGQIYDLKKYKEITDKVFESENPALTTYNFVKKDIKNYKKGILIRTKIESIYKCIKCPMVHSVHNLKDYGCDGHNNDGECQCKLVGERITTITEKIFQ